MNLDGNTIVEMILFIVGSTCYIIELFQVIYKNESTIYREITALILSICITYLIYVASKYTNIDITSIYLYGVAAISVVSISHEVLEHKLEIYNGKALLIATGISIIVTLAVAFSFN